MKKLVAILFVLVFVIVSIASAEDNKTETVVQMTYIVKMPDVIREGLYTGEVLNGVPHGYGVFETTNSEGVNWHYLGTWTNGSMTGNGGQYWDNGRSSVGEFENGDMLCGYWHYSPTVNMWADYRTNENGCIKVKMYRTDGSVYFDGYADAKSGKYTEGIVYTKDNKVFFDGKIGEGFDWNLIYVE